MIQHERRNKELQKNNNLSKDLPTHKNQNFFDQKHISQTTFFKRTVCGHIHHQYHICGCFDVKRKYIFGTVSLKICSWGGVVVSATMIFLITICRHKILTIWRHFEFLRFWKDYDVPVVRKNGYYWQGSYFEFSSL